MSLASFEPDSKRPRLDDSDAEHVTLSTTTFITTSATDTSFFQISLDGLAFIMGLCDVFAIVKTKGQAVFCNSVEKVRAFLVEGVEYCILNNTTSVAQVYRQCCRIQCPLFLFDGTCEFLRYIPEPSRKHKNEASTILTLESFDHICDISIQSNQLPIIIFNMESLESRDKKIIRFGQSFLFIGSLDVSSQLLVVQFMSTLNVNDIEQSFQNFTDDQATVNICESEPYFAGFFLHAFDYDKLKSDIVKKLLCKVAPVIIELSESSIGEKTSYWFVSSTSCCPIHISKKSQGWIIYFQKPDISSCVHHGIDVFFDRSQKFVSSVDPATLKEVRLGRFFGCLDDAVRAQVPHCNTMLKDLKFHERFPDLYSENLVRVEENTIWTFIDASSCDCVHVLALLNRNQFKQINKIHKPKYLRAIAWIVSRSQLVERSQSRYSEKYFAVRTSGCFMTNQMSKIDAKTDAYYNLFKTFYGSSTSVVIDEVPGQHLFSQLDKITSKSLLQQHVREKSNPYDVSSVANILFTQLYNVNDLERFRSTVNLLPTLEFFENSCWMESAINMLFSLPVARIRTFVSRHPLRKCFESLYTIMCVYGHTFSSLVPILECVRCGVYPASKTDFPRVLGEEGYRIIFESDHDGWGSSGCAMEALLRFLGYLDVSVTSAIFNDSEYTVQIQSSTFSDDVLIVHFTDGLHGDIFDYRDIVEILPNRLTLAAVHFNNLAHCFSVCKAVNSADWTVKDALVRQYQTFSTLPCALKHASEMHCPSELFFPSAAIYYK